MGIADHPPAKRELRDELWTNISADLSQGSRFLFPLFSGCRSVFRRRVVSVVGLSFRVRLQPKSVIRVQSDFVLLPCRLAVAFVEGVAGYVETKRQTRCR